MRKVLTTCLTTGQAFATHATMTPQQFDRLTTALAVYCPVCRQPHLIGRDRLWLEGGRNDARARAALATNAEDALQILTDAPESA